MCVCEYIYHGMCEWLTLRELEPPPDPDLGPAIWTYSNTSTPSTDAGVLHFDQIKLGGSFRVIFDLFLFLLLL